METGNKKHDSYIPCLHRCLWSSRHCPRSLCVPLLLLCLWLYNGLNHFPPKRRGVDREREWECVILWERLGFCDSGPNVVIVGEEKTRGSRKDERRKRKIALWFTLTPWRQRQMLINAAESGSSHVREGFLDMSPLSAYYAIEMRKSRGWEELKEGQMAPCLLFSAVC